jgi:hypothetical protein
VKGGEPGFFGSWYTARVTGVSASGGVCVRYLELLKDDNTAETDEVHDYERLRPPLGPWAQRQRNTPAEARDASRPRLKGAFALLSLRVVRRAC